MALDGATISAFFGFLGIAVTAIAGIFVATRTNQVEKQNSAKLALEQVRDEAHEARLTLRDEQLAECERGKIVLNLRVEELESENDQLRVENHRLKGLTNAD